MTKNPIVEQLDAARAEVDSLRGQVARAARLLEIAQARLEAFEVASKAFEDAAPKMKGGKVVRTRNRLPSSDWQAVFQALHKEHVDGFGYDEIYGMALTLGVEAKRASLRTKLMNYANEGHVERIDNGRFAITRKGLGYFKIEAGDSSNENGATEAAPEAGEVSGATLTNPLRNTQPSWMS